MSRRGFPEPCKRFKDARDRRSHRYEQLGEENETQVAEFLRSCRDEHDQPIFSRVTNHQKYSLADHSGKDITVVCGGVERSFDISISGKRVREARLRYPNIPQFEVPIGFNPENLLRRVLSLLDQETKTA